MPGWEDDISEARSFAELPANARAYLEAIEELVGVPIALVGVGPGRDQVFWTEAGRQSAVAEAPVSRA
jgi:adenylosuccinate synthase